MSRDGSTCIPAEGREGDRKKGRICDGGRQRHLRPALMEVPGDVGGRLSVRGEVRWVLIEECDVHVREWSRAVLLRQIGVFRVRHSYFARLFSCETMSGRSTIRSLSSRVCVERRNSVASW